MKIVLSIILITIYCSCNPTNKVMQNYFYVEPFKEQEVKLFLNDDSTFIFQDLTGCNQFVYTGKYRQVKDSILSYLLFNSVEFKNVLPNGNPDLIFSIETGDTATILNNERIFIHHQIFIATSNRSINLQKIRYKKLEDYYTDLLGKKGFLKTFGDGSRRKAKKRLMQCALPDIDYGQHQSK